MHNARLYVFVGGLILGAYLSSFITGLFQSAVFLYLGLAFFVIVMAGIFVLVIFRHQIISVKFLLFVVCGLGILTGLSRACIWLSFNHAGVLDDLVNKKVSITGLVIEEPQMSDASSKVLIKTLTNSISGTTSAALILVTADRYTTASYGDEIKISGKLQSPKPIASTDGIFAYDVYLARQGIFYTMTFPSVFIIAHHRLGFVRENLINLKNNFLDEVNKLFVSPKSGLLAGLLVSGRSSLSKSEQATFTRAGLIHIVALSGFNVTIIAEALMFVLIFLPKKIRLIIGATGIVAFVVMTGFGATIVRAGLMALLVIFAALVRRNYEVGRALFLAIFFMIIWNPMVIYDVSFQLSCVATFAVIFAVPLAIIKYAPSLKFLPAKFKIRETALGTAIIEIFLLPILLSTSGQISLVTVITNLLVLPTLPVVMGFGFLATLLGYLNFAVALPAIALSNLMLDYILLVTNFFANIPFGVFSFSLPWLVVVGMYALLAFWFYRLQKAVATKNSESKIDPEFLQKFALTQANLERVQNFLQSHSN